MTEEPLSELLAAVRDGGIEVEDALERLRGFPVDASVAGARIDTHRKLRTGAAEVVFCPGKTPEQVAAILRRLLDHHGRALGTRATPELARQVRERLPAAAYDPVSRLITLGWRQDRDGHGEPQTGAGVMVVTAGTSDLPVAEEAAQTLEFLGGRVDRCYDVGVAGLHRLLAVRPRLERAAVVICVAGMEGALTSVVGGLLAAPVIGVPTSVGYGAHLGGAAPLLAMLNSCAAGVAVVNIDNGFGAALMAHAIIRQVDAAGAGSVRPPDSAEAASESS
ncbi:MAG: nickel pincer cofactor biosynthesis protein LarB [Spirochaetaceae bacterium]|nr:nickel pincer cofactor biosynthesis protein LarB [Spirochaetaceae bacterium]